MALWTEIKPAELTAFSRVAYQALDTDALSSILPAMYQNEVKFTWKVNGLLNGVAKYGEFDTEAPIGGTMAGEEKTMRLLPVSIKLPFSEYEQVVDRAAIRQTAQDKADAVVRMVVNRITQIRAQALVNGALSINENGLVLGGTGGSFGRAANQTLVAPSTLWSAGGDPIADLRAWSDRIADASGVVPDMLVMSTRVFSALSARLGASGYLTTGQTMVSRDAATQVMTSFGLPAPTIYDGRVNGTRVLADNVVILAPSGGAAGATVFAPTVESTLPEYGLAPGQRSGIIAGAYREDDPPIQWVLGKAVALPVLANPNTTLSATVL